MTADFGSIHHVPDWRSVAEIRRVLRPHGRFYFLEVSRHFRDRWVVRTLLAQPDQDRFTASEFVTDLHKEGIEVDDRLVQRFRGGIFAGVGLAA